MHTQAKKKKKSNHVGFKILADSGGGINGQLICAEWSPRVYCRTVRRRSLSDRQLLTTKNISAVRAEYFRSRGLHSNLHLFNLITSIQLSYIQLTSSPSKYLEAVIAPVTRPRHRNLQATPRVSMATRPWPASTEYVRTLRRPISRLSFE